MASLLAGARLLVRQGLRLLPAYRVRPTDVPLRCLSSSAKFLTRFAQDLDSRSSIKPDIYLSQFDHFTIANVGIRFGRHERFTKTGVLRIVEMFCEKGVLSSIQVTFLLKICSSSLCGLHISERAKIINGVWNRIQELGFVFNEDHYNLLLKAYNDNGCKFSPTEFLAGMEAAGVEPDRTTYERLIAAYCSEGDIIGASKILGFLKSSNFPITLEIFCSLIRGHARAGDMESAKNMLSVMQEAGLVPEINAYTELLCAYAEKGDIESINQTLEECDQTLLEKACLPVIKSLAMTGHCQFVPDMFVHMPCYPKSNTEVMNLCKDLLANDCGDIALAVTKQHYSTSSNQDFFAQPTNFLIRHCLELNLPIDTIKKYMSALKESNLHPSPLNFALKCALENNNTVMALELMNAIKEEGDRLKTHYFWPMLASCLKNDDAKGFFQHLKTMQEMKVNVTAEAFIYASSLFANSVAAESILEETGFQNEFSQLYLLVLKREILQWHLPTVHFLLSSNIPFPKHTDLINAFKTIFLRYRDVEMLAMITKLLFRNDDSFQNSSLQSESFGYFLYGLLVNTSELELEDKVEHLKQYFHHLKKMGFRLHSEKGGLIINLLTSRNVPQLIQDIRELIDNSLDEKISELERRFENEKANGRPSIQALRNLIRILCKKEDVERVKELTEKHNADYDFALFMTVLGFFCNKGDPVEALKVKEMSQSRFNIIPATRKYIQLLGVLALSNRMEDAINVLKEMQDRHVTVDQDTHKSFNRILNTLASKGDVDGVNILHKNIVMLGLAKPTNLLCEPLVKVHMHRNDFSAAVNAMVDIQLKYRSNVAHDLLLSLIENGETDLLKCALDNILNTFGEREMLLSLLVAFLGSGNYEEAKNIAETPGLRASKGKIKWFVQKCRFEKKTETLEKCLEITRGVFQFDREESYYELLLLYKDTKEWAKAVPLWYNMKEEGLKVQMKTVELFKELFAKNGQDILAHIPEFFKFEDQVDKDIRIDITNDEVIQLCQESKFIEAHERLMVANQSNKPLNKLTYTNLIRGLLSAGLLEDALEVEEVVKRHFPDYSMQSYILKLSIEEQVKGDDLKGALVTLRDMSSKNCRPIHKTLYTLSKSFAMKGDLASLEEMEEITKSFDVDFPYMEKKYFNCRLLAHLINGNFEESTSLFESLYREKPWNVSNLSLLLTLVKNGSSEALEHVIIVAERLANQFSVYGLITDVFLLYVRTDKIEEAKQLLERFNGILQQREILGRYVSKRDTASQRKYSSQVVEVLEEYDPFYRQFTYNSLLRQYVKSQNVDGALELYEKMNAEGMEADNIYLIELADLLRKKGRPVPFSQPQDFEQ